MVMKFITKIALLLTITLPVALLMLTTGNPADARCFKFQRDCGASASTSKPTTRIITDDNRIRRGDLYDPKPMAESRFGTTPAASRAIFYRTGP